MVPLLNRFIINKNSTNIIYQLYRNVFLSYIRENVTTALTVTTNSEKLLGQQEKDEFDEVNKNVSVLEELPNLEDVSHIGPPIDFKSFNFAPFADNSVVLQKLVDLGVDFYKIEQRKVLPTYLLQLNFEENIQPYISFLHDNGVPSNKLGRFFTKNPFFFQVNLEDLQVRINYLESKEFTKEMISTIITTCPLWLQYSTVDIDNKLGYFQREFHLKGHEIRQLCVKAPSIILNRQEKLQKTLWEIKDVVGFSKEQCKNLLLNVPYIWTINPDNLKARIDFMLTEMELSLDMIAANPFGMVNRVSRMRERHLFLKSLGKAQYDPTKPNFISIRMITHGNDASFCEFVAKTSIETYNMFLKTL